MNAESPPEIFVVDPYPTQARSRVGYLDSCIVFDQRLALIGGKVMPAGEVLARVRAGQVVEVRGSDPLTGRPVANRVIAACPTYSRAYEVVFGDGRSVCLTGSHALPGVAPKETDSCEIHGVPVEAPHMRYLRASPPGVSDSVLLGKMARNSGQSRWRPSLDEEEGRKYAKMLQAERLECFADAYRPLEAGEELADGRVEAVRELGKKEAVRLWTAFPDWIRTEEMVRVGTRWHETLAGWGVWQKDHEDPEDATWSSYNILKAVAFPPCEDGAWGFAQTLRYLAEANHARWRTDRADLIMRDHTDLATVRSRGMRVRWLGSQAQWPVPLVRMAAPDSRKARQALPVVSRMAA